MEDIQKIIKDLEAEGGQAIGNPKTMQKLRESGIDIPDGSCIIPWSEYVNGVFSEENKKKAIERLQKLPQLPDIPVPAIISIYREILKNIALGLNGAAITLSCVLVEYVLKVASYKVEIGGFKRYDAAMLDEFEKLEFGDAVGRAAKNGLLSGQEKKDLHQFRDKFRNPYLHYNLKKITSKIYIKDLKVLNTKTGEIDTKDVRAEDDQVIQAQAKPFADETNVHEVFRFANKLVLSLWSKIEHLQNVPSKSVPEVIEDNS
jgi:hypothetical protein